VLPVSSLKVDHEKEIGIIKLPYGELDKCSALIIMSVFVWLIIIASTFNLSFYELLAVRCYAFTGAHMGGCK
jgi:hypothetical protein